MRTFRSIFFSSIETNTFFLSMQVTNVALNRSAAGNGDDRNAFIIIHKYDTFFLFLFLKSKWKPNKHENSKNQTKPTKIRPYVSHFLRCLPVVAGTITTFNAVHAKRARTHTPHHTMHCNRRLFVFNAYRVKIAQPMICFTLINNLLSTNLIVCFVWTTTTLPTAHN